jgi:formiminoglutamase
VRWHDRIRPLAPGEAGAPGVALLGFACDVGVARNQGRPGAAEGPAALRRALAGVAWHGTRPLWDAGDVVPDMGPRDGVPDMGGVVPDGEALEAAQAELGEAVARLLDAGHLPVVVGGGHEVAAGSFLGLAAWAARRSPARRLGVVNLDAHLDLRAGRASSGTPFRQIAEACAARGWPFRYLCVGVDEASNTGALFDTAARLGARWRRDREATPGRLDEARAELAAFVATVEAVHLSVDLDALPAAVAPGVSAPAARGLALEVVEGLVDVVLGAGKLALFEVAELAPRFDVDGRTARVAARLVDQVARQ